MSGLLISLSCSCPKGWTSMAAELISIQTEKCHNVRKDAQAT